MDNFSNVSKLDIVIRIFLFIMGGFLTLGIVIALSAIPITNRFFAALSGADFSLCSGYEDVSPAIEQVERKSEAHKLIIGDSVCKQIFTGLQADNPDYCIAGTYCTVGLSGQYILASEFLKTHPDATDIYLIMRPQSMSAQLDSQKAYMYAVAPFAVKGILEDLDEETIDDMRDMYWNYGIDKFSATLIVNSPMIAKVYLNKLQDEHFVENQPANGVSEISVFYLNKIKELCDDNQVDFHFLSVPVPDNVENHYMIDNIVEQTKESTVSQMIRNMCDTVIFCDENYFLDGQHLDSNKIQFGEVIQWLQQTDVKLRDLQLGES